MRKIHVDPRLLWTVIIALHWVCFRLLLWVAKWMTDRISSCIHSLSCADLFWHLIILKHHRCYFFSQTRWIDAVFCFHPLELHLTTEWSHNWLLSAIYKFSLHNSFSILGGAERVIICISTISEKHHFSHQNKIISTWFSMFLKVFYAH